MIGPLPGDGERGNRAGARAADAVALRILRDVVLLVEHRHQLVDDDPRVLVVERVVFRRPVGGPIAPVLRRRLGLFGCPAGVDEHRDHHRDLAPVDQVVEHVRHPEVAVHVLERLAVIEDHQACRHGRVVLRGHVDPVGMLRAGIRLARQRERTTNLSLGRPLPSGTSPVQADNGYRDRPVEVPAAATRPRADCPATAMRNDEERGVFRIVMVAENLTYL